MPHPVDLFVGKKLKQRRVSIGMSQENLANAVGITFQQVQKYERGANRMGASRLYEFAKVLGVPVGYFFDGYENAGIAAESVPVTGVAEESVSFEHEPLSTSRELLEFVRSYQRIKDPRQRKALSVYIRSVADGKPTIED